MAGIDALSGYKLTYTDKPNYWSTLDDGAVLNARWSLGLNAGPSGNIGDVIIGASSSAAQSPVYLRDLVDISRGYQSPAKYLNYLTWADKDGHWRRSRAVTVAVQMKDGEQIDAFGRSVDAKLAAVKQYLPDDLIIARTADQPLQVEEGIVTAFPLVNL